MHIKERKGKERKGKERKEKKRTTVTNQNYIPEKLKAG
jgi:hypothetical protein